MTQTTTSILLIGLGELGSAFLPHITALPNTHTTIGLRNPSRHESLPSETPNTALIELDITWSTSKLAPTLAEYDIVISATGFASGGDGLIKLARDALEAGNLRKAAGKSKLWFFPWQWGVDYDVTGDGEGQMPFFGAQKEVRDLLRREAAAAGVTWTVVSVGIFMSFVFEAFWGILDKRDSGITVRALKSWDHRITTTAVEDIGKVLAQILKGNCEAEDRVVFAAGDTVSYQEFADIIERVTGSEVRRELWSIPYLQEDLEKHPDNLIKKYRLAFARDGVWWDKESTINHKLGMDVTGVEAHAKKLFGV